MIARVEHLAEGVTLYCDDSQRILEELSADVLVTDPPWGIGDLSGTTSLKRRKNIYASYIDTEHNVIQKIIPIVKQALYRCGERGLVACGVRQMWRYPAPRAVGGFYQPAAVGMSPWGFAGFNPVLFYGKDPRDGKGQSSVMTTLTEKPSTPEHPCAKPDAAMMWMVNKGSLKAEVVMDPFMGSGTTGIAAVKLGRKFIGIEIDEGYFDIACRRIEAALLQPDMFIEPPKPVKQEAFI